SDRPPRATGTYAERPDGPASYPARPTNVTAESARGYAERFEEARVTNVLYEPDVENSRVDCRAVHDTDGNGGQYVLATCTGSARYADGRYAEHGQSPALYYVGPGLTVRVEELADRSSDCEAVFASSDPTENFAEPCEGRSASYCAYNLGPERHTLSVTVERRSASGAEPVLERTYELVPPNSSSYLDPGVRQGSVTYRRGTYRLTATLENEATATYRWKLRSGSDSPVAIVVSPTNTVAVRRLPTV
ncbi:hypothetical protein ACFQE1_17410, partial [Halobium palmae]